MGFQVDFVPFTETQKLTVEEKISYILAKVMKKTILVLENGLSPEEELKLIKNTMHHIDYSQFLGIKLISFAGGEAMKKAKLFGKAPTNKAFTIVAPNDAVEVIKDERGILSIRINT